MRFKPGDKAKIVVQRPDNYGPEIGETVTIEKYDVDDGTYLVRSDNESKCWLYDWKLEPLEPPVYDAKSIQLCPKCNGQGIVSRPPWIPGDVFEWSAAGTATSYTCNLCNGTKVIPIPEPLEASPVQEEESRPSVKDYFDDINEAAHQYTTAPKLFRYAQAVDNYADQLESTISNLRKELEELKKQKI